MSDVCSHVICLWCVCELTVLRTLLNISSIDKFLVAMCISSALVYMPWLLLPSDAFCPGEVEKAIIVPLGAYTGASPSFVTLLHVTKGLFRQASKIIILVLTPLSSKVSITKFRGREVYLHELSSAKLVLVVAKKFSPLHWMPWPAKKNRPTFDFDKTSLKVTSSLSIVAVSISKKHFTSKPNSSNLLANAAASLTAFLRGQSRYLFMPNKMAVFCMAVFSYRCCYIGYILNYIKENHKQIYLGPTWPEAGRRDEP